MAPDPCPQPGHVVPGLHARLHDLQEGALLSRARQLRPAGADCEGAGDRGAVRVLGQVSDRAGPPVLRHPRPPLQEAVGAVRPQREPAPRVAGNTRLSRQTSQVIHCN